MKFADLCDSYKIGKNFKFVQIDIGSISMGESNTVVSAYTVYGYLKQYCSHPSIWS